MLRRVMRDFRMGLKKEVFIDIFRNNGWFSYLYLLGAAPLIMGVYKRVFYNNLLCFDYTICFDFPAGKNSADAAAKDYLSVSTE